MKQHRRNRILALVLAAVMVLGWIPTVSAAPEGLSWRESGTEVTLDRTDRLVGETDQTEIHKPTDMVRVAIILEDRPTIKAGFSTMDIASNADAMTYNANLERVQADMARSISAQALGGGKLDVVWNLTLVSNIISANVPYGKLDAIKAVDGVADVVLERRYTVDELGEIGTNTYHSAGMIGTGPVWQSGYTGAGMRVAIIDTGTDTDHQSFRNDAYLYALKQNAAAKGMSYEAYVESLDLLDADEIRTVAAYLNATERVGASAEQYYINEKLPFGANYVDYNLVVDHDHDNQGSHGSHVAGIATANRYIPSGGGFVDAREAVRVSGVAPDAQLITLKVFGYSPGPYDTDYFAAIEDAILLGCDSVNLSLGSSVPGYSNNTLFTELLEFMATTDTVVVMSAGNSGAWADATTNYYLYSDGVSFHTGGSPGSYTNAFTVASVDSDGGAGTGDYTMSSFSSWGVPGSLELKPEITAPGGNILSVNGVDRSGTAYEYMSGTSMAAPQVTGMAALVSQYIQEKGLDSKTGLSPRVLAQSLLMSTAVPMYEEDSGGGYYSLLSQGAGLARVDLATTAGSYILVEEMADGKVKAELGDDPDRSGHYYFAFSLNDISGKDTEYALWADMFTQDIFEGIGGFRYLDKWTRELPVKAVFRVNGVSMEGVEAGFDRDLNGDGITGAADADHLLEYLLGNEARLYADGDVNGDGKVTSYDAHVLLTKLTGVSLVEVPANGSVTVEVDLILSEEARSFLDANYPTGAYIESFVYAEPAGAGATHSIPVLGYYGSWTEPSMYDVGSYHEFASGGETRTPYLYQLNGTESNFLTVYYADGSEYIFGGNSVTEEEAYIPERNAFNNRRGAMLYNLYFTQIRNAADSMVLLENADTGEVYLSETLGPVESAYYHVNMGAWQNTRYRQAVGLFLNDIPEGTRLKLSLITAPEYYTHYEGGQPVTDWEALGEGAYLTVPFTIDNTAPAVKNVALGEDNILRVTARDKEYIAGVALLDASGSRMLAAAPANQTVRGQEITVELPMDGVFGSEFRLAVVDYAENIAVSEITLELDSRRPYFTAIDCTNLNSDGSANYVGLEADGTVALLNPAIGREPARAAEYVEGAVFEISGDNKLYAARNEDLFDVSCLGELDPAGEWQITGFNDLAYNKADGKLYGMFYSAKNNMQKPYLCTIDLYSGGMKVLGQMPIDANTLAIDGAGNFYSTVYGLSELYTYTADVIKTGKTRYVGYLDDYKTTTVNSMAWDHNANELYWAVTDSENTELLKVDPKTAKTTFVSDFDFHACGLFIAYEPGTDLFAPTDKVTSVTLPETAFTMVNSTTQLTARVNPWNVSNKSVKWTTSNASVATVDANGVVTGVSAGTAVITATARLDTRKTASCTVTVGSLSKELKAVIWDEEGGVWWSRFNTDTIPAFTKLKQTSGDLPVNATMVAGGKLYASTLDTSYGVSELYTVDPKTFEMTRVGPSSIAYLDMAYAPNLGYGMAVYFNYVALVDLQTGDYVGAFDWTAGVADSLVGITYYGSQYNSNYGAWMDLFLILDKGGNVYLEAFMDTGSEMGYFKGPEAGFLRSIGDPVDYDYFQGFHFDGTYTYWARYHEADNIVELIAWDTEGTDDVYSLGTFPEGVWPVGGLYTDAQLTASGALMDGALATAELNAAGLLFKIPEMELTAGMAGGALNAVSSTLPAEVMSRAQVNDRGDVELAVTLPADGTNGRLTLTFDSHALELVEVAGVTDAFAWNQTGERITVAFADRAALSGDAACALVRFRARSEGETTVSVHYTELNDGALEHREEISLALPHNCPSEKFVDVNEGDWWHEAVDYVVSRGYMNGMDATHYGPAATMNRAQFVTVLYRMEGEPAVSNTGKFKDVPKGQFYTNAAYWALSAGITTGTGDGTTFNPGGQLTRTELVTFMYRYAKYKGYDISASANLSGYRDAAQVPGFSKTAWSWAITHGIITGMTADTLAPMNLTNRAQAAVIFQRFDTKLVR